MADQRGSPLRRLCQGAKRHKGRHFCRDWLHVRKRVNFEPHLAMNGVAADLVEGTVLLILTWTASRFATDSSAGISTSMLLPVCAPGAGLPSAVLQHSQARNLACQSHSASNACKGHQHCNGSNKMEQLILAAEARC